MSQQQTTSLLDMRTLISGYTIDAAYQLHMEDEIGPVAVGKRADLVVLGKNLFFVDAYDIHKTKVMMTLMGGKIVFEREDQRRVQYMNKWLRASGALLVILALLLWAFTPGPLQRDLPRTLPWELPDYRLANTHWEVGTDGRIYTQVEHFFLTDISPEMLAWFYQQLPISTVQLDGVTYTLYHIFHPTEHGNISVVQAAPDGTLGMASGAVIQRDEWFGPFDSRGAAKIVELSPEGMFAIPVAGPFNIGEVRHRFRALNGGTAYTVDVVIGSELPILGPLLNLYLRKRVFHPEMLEQWQRHQIEEVASLQFFLPQIYAQRDSGTHFVLE